ncbi:hypothetical protein [Vibrio penaeicida]|uniref:Uncharacterized protein n=1 Tax=Vibrio penaeicida TaxID=104609 RepID=A0AAV5NVH0_9VIBR|nr:hypothetical protein [Vibrio penaeicida]RTZ22592.1 hypothetical protein EKN09_13345 [Vibrio penaeicida]GLQ74730.1 hypothetical protein GCM10007932_40910 [Vibrio penaeicida]
MKYTLAVLTLSISGMLNAAEITADLPSGAMGAVRMHTNDHSNHGARDMALVKISGLQGGCDRGVFLDASADKATLSLILSAYVSKSAVQIGYEPTLKSPWGDSRYCAITYFDIK